MSRQMSDQLQKIRARARLALRAEQAFGLDALSIQIDRGVSAPPQSAPLQLPQPASAAPVSVAPVSEARKAVVNLFGGGAPQAPSLPAVPITGPVFSSEEKRRLLAELDEKQTR